MKVVFTCNRLGFGGAERVISNFANRIIEDGHQVKIICLDIIEGFHYNINDKVEIIELDVKYKERKSFLNRKISGFINLYKLYVKLKDIKPDVIISFYTRQNCYSIFIGNLLGIPVIASERDHFFTTDSKINKLMRRFFYPHASGFIHQTQWAREYLRKHYKIKKYDIVLPNPIWIKDYPEKCTISNQIISVGRLDEQKNFEGLIRAFSKVAKKIPSATLYIYGEGKQRKNLEILIEQLNLTERVYLPGWYTDIINCYARAEIFVLFSYGEGYPNALMEALSMGVPSISSNCPIGGPADMIINGYNGILVTPGDENELAENIVYLLNNEQVREKFSNNAIKIRETNDFEYIYKKLINYIYTCIYYKRMV